jgi:pSer/pThr/pTyr-binding forkhead associated (FHA) protein
MNCVLDILQGPAAGKRICLQGDQCLEIGRTGTADFSIPTDSHLSRRHFLLDSTGKACRIRDVGSSNGTFVNDKRITVTELRDGDTIRAGVTVFRVSFRPDGVEMEEPDRVLFSSPSQEEPTDLLDIKTARRSVDFPNYGGE